jgi:hypothetical protein
MSYEDEPMDQDSVEGPDPERSRVADKVKLPAIFLIVVGVLNALFGLYEIGSGGYQALSKNNEATKQQMEKELQKNTQLSKEQREQFQNFFGKIADVGPVTNVVLGVLGLLAAAVTIFGGVQMISLRMRGLAILGSILAAIPCLSLMGCCGVGEGIGIWSLIVLMSADVKAAFR